MIRFTILMVAALALGHWIPKAQAEYIDVEALAKRLSTPSVWVEGHWSGGHWVKAHQRGTSWVVGHWRKVYWVKAHWRRK